MENKKIITFERKILDISLFKMRTIILTLLTALIAVGTFAQTAGVKYTPQNNAEFAKIIAGKHIQLIDVRTPSEFEEGHLPGAINMDIKGENFDQQVKKLTKKHPVALYCRSGGRSKLAAEKLATLGFTVYELSTGISKWDGEIITQ